MDITRRQAILLIFVVILALGSLVVADQLIERVSPWNYDDFERWMDDLGPWGPIVYMIFFAVSMVIAPIPTGPAPVAAAAAFGGLAGFFYTTLAGAVGASLCFVIARRWGPPLLRRFLPERVVDEIDRVAQRLGLRVLLILRLFPLLGVDAVSYAAGLTRIGYLPYLGVSIVGSIPVLALVSLIGEGARDDRMLAVIGVVGLGVFLILPLSYLALRARHGDAVRPAQASGEAEPVRSEVADPAEGPGR